MRNVLFGALCLTLSCFCFVDCKAKDDDKLETEKSQVSLFIKTAKSQIGVEENPKGSNRGEMVDAYNLTCGKEFLGAPWCSSFTRWCFYQIGKKDVPGAYSPSWYKKDRVIEANNVQPGDQALIYFNSLGRFAHTITCITEVSRVGGHVREITTIEGNSNLKGSREGFAVVSRIRPVDSVTVVRWN